FSHLNRRGTVFLRYMVGDVGALDHAACPHCGRGSVRLSSHTQRTGDIVKIRGALVNLGNLKGYLDQIQEIDEYRLVVSSEVESDPFSTDVLTLEIAPAASSAPDAVGEMLIAEIRKLTNLRA